jgi:hypothetical protein
VLKGVPERWCLYRVVGETAGSDAPPSRRQSRSCSPGTERSYRVTDVNREGDALLASVTLIDLTELGDDESPTILVRRRANRVGTGLPS